MKKPLSSLCASLFWLYFAVLSLAGANALASAELVSIEWVGSDDTAQLELRFAQQPAQSEVFLLDGGSQLVVDLFAARAQPSLLTELTLRDPRITAAQFDDKIRLVAQLTEPMSFTQRQTDSQLIIDLQPPAAVESKLVGLDFRRTEGAVGQLELRFDGSDFVVDASKSERQLVLHLPGSQVQESLLRELDVLDFDTPIARITVTQDEGSAQLKLTARAPFEYLLVQREQSYLVTLTPPSGKEPWLDAGETYRGERLSLNFQDIEVRSVLQIIAEFTSLNLVASDTVTGNITLWLDDVPWAFIWRI